jgi:muconolactone delta-isomerase
VLFLVELDHVKSGLPVPSAAGQDFIEQVILPTLARAEKLLAEKKIVAGGPVVGRIALRFIVAADSLPEVDQVVSSLPIWPLAESRVTPLVGFEDRENSVRAILESLKSRTVDQELSGVRAHE